MITCRNTSGYLPGERVMSLACLSPEFGIGTLCKVLIRADGRLLAVQTSDGDIFRWLSIFELEPIDPDNHILLEGSYAYVTTERLSPSLSKDSIVRIIKRVDQTDYYEITPDEGIHRFKMPGIVLTNRV
jgi:hypothetical protein